MIYVECYPDKTLVNCLGISKREINHAFSKGNVCNKLEKSKNSKGMVDEDPSSAQPGYIQKLKIISDENDIRVLYGKEGKNLMIVLCPRLEEWILKAAKEVNANMKKYGLPDDADKLHKIISSKPGRHGGFEKLIADIRNKSKMLIKLESLIKS